MNAEQIWDKFSQENRLTDEELDYLLDFYDKFQQMVREAGASYGCITMDIVTRQQVLRNIKFHRQNSI